MKKILSITAVAFMLASGSAFAQTDPAAATGDPGAADKAMYQPFYTDESMSTLRSDEEFTAAWVAMTPENQAKVREQCVDPASPRLKDFCGRVPPAQ